MQHQFRRAVSFNFFTFPFVAATRVKTWWCLHSGRSVASGLNEDFDATSIDRQQTIDLPPVVLSVAGADVLSSSVDTVSSYPVSSLTDALPTSRDVSALTAEFFIPPPHLLTASGYRGSHGSLPEVTANHPDGMRKVGMGPQVLKKSFNQAFGKLSDRMKVQIYTDCLWTTRD